MYRFGISSAIVAAVGVFLVITHIPKTESDWLTTPVIQLKTNFTNSFKGKDGKIHAVTDSQFYHIQPLAKGCRILPAGTRYWISLPTGKGKALELHPTVAAEPFVACRADK